MFWPEAKSEHYINNMTESFNNWIGKLRGVLIISIIEGIRQKCMMRLRKRYSKACSWEGECLMIFFTVAEFVD